MKTMQITLDISEEDAETLVFACVLRAKQKGLDARSATRAEILGNLIACAAGKAFNWHDLGMSMLAHKLWPIKHVTIKTYETNPNPKP